MLSEKKIHKIGRIDQIVRDYFDAHPSQNEVAAKDLMALFIKKGIFKKDNKEGNPITEFIQVIFASTCFFKRNRNLIVLFIFYNGSS